ncbi:MAG: hypothetical protein AB7O98_14605 [Hyphomonadaceae bacterium]
MAEKTGLAGWSAIIGTWVSIFGAAAGGFMALQTYEEQVQKMEDARVVQTFSLYEMFNSGERLQARAALFAHTKDGAPLDANQLYVMLDFFDALQICVERGLCNEELSVRLFQSYAVPFWDGMGAQIVASRTESDPSFGAGLQWMASLPVPPPLDASVETVPAPAAVEEAPPAEIAPAEAEAPTQ